MAHKKGGGSSTNGRDSHGQRLGVKRFGGQPLPVRIAAVCRGAAALLMCHDAILFEKTAALESSAARRLELDVSDLNSRIVLPMTARNLVLAALLELEYGQFLGAALSDDLAAHAGLAGVVANQNFLVVRVDSQDGTKIDLFSYFAINPLDADGVAGRDAILLPPGLNNGVHRSSKSKRQTLIIGVSDA